MSILATPRILPRLQTYALLHALRLQVSRRRTPTAPIEQFQTLG